MGAKANEEMFPALPIGKKPNTLMAGLTRGTVRWDDGSNGNTAAANPWGSGANGPAGGGPNPAAADGMAESGGDAGNTAGAGKKGKKGKQILYRFG